jgi:hypothetical protein
MTNMFELRTIDCSGSIYRDDYESSVSFAAKTIETVLEDIPVVESNMPMIHITFQPVSKLKRGEVDHYEVRVTMGDACLAFLHVIYRWNEVSGLKVFIERGDPKDV